MQRFARFFYIKLKEGEREQDSRETERECVWEAECCCKRKIASAIKQTVREQTCDANVWLISEMKNVANDVAPTIHICSSVVSKPHLDLTTSHKFPIISQNTLAYFTQSEFCNNIRPITVNFYLSRNWIASTKTIKPTWFFFVFLLKKKNLLFVEICFDRDDNETKWFGSIFLSRD